MGKCNWVTISAGEEVKSEEAQACRMEFLPSHPQDPRDTHLTVTMNHSVPSSRLTVKVRVNLL